MDESGPIASTSQQHRQQDDLFGAFYAPLQRAQAHKQAAALGYLDDEHGLAVQWARAIAARLDVADGDLDSEDARGSLQLEASTWQLLQALYLDRTSPPRSASQRAAVDKSFPYTPPLTLVQRAISNSASLSELSIVKDWLCATAADSIHPAEVRKGYLPYTKNKLKQAIRTGQASSSSNLVDTLDPDATNRLGSDGKTRRVLDSEDANYEKALVRSLWEYVRVGELDQAIDMCRQSDCSWRAASLSGGKLYEDDQLARASAEAVYSPEEADDMDVLAAYEGAQRASSGNLRRKLWKSMCRALAETGHLDMYEKALYGAISGDTDSVLPVAHTWEDHLWVRVNALLESEIDAILAQAEENGNWLLQSANADIDSSSGLGGKAGKSKDVPRAMQEIFNTLLAEPKLKAEARSPFHVAQSWIILNRTNDLLNSFVSKLEASAGELDEPCVLFHTSLRHCCWLTSPFRMFTAN